MNKEYFLGVDSLLAREFSSLLRFDLIPVTPSLPTHLPPEYFANLATMRSDFISNPFFMTPFLGTQYVENCSTSCTSLTLSWMVREFSLSMTLGDNSWFMLYCWKISCEFQKHDNMVFGDQSIL